MCEEVRFGVTWVGPGGMGFGVGTRMGADESGLGEGPRMGAGGIGSGFCNV